MKFEELQGFIQQSLQNIDENELFHNEIGYIISIKDQIVIASGLNNVQFDEMVQIDENIFGVVNKIDRNCIFILLLYHKDDVREGMEIKRMHKFLSVDVNESFVNKVFDAYGNTIDGSIISGEKTTMIIDNEAQPMINRAAITKQLVTGIKCIDNLTPVGYGQREVILGHRGTGKTSIFTDIMINLKNNPNDITIYVSIGQPGGNATKIQELLKENNVNNSIIIVANGSHSAAERFYAPYTAVAIAEYFMFKGKNVVIGFDDLNQHAIAHREICLTMKRSVGREAYPSDIFYVHARLLERACFLNELRGGGSISILPIMEIYGDDISSYITTNVVSIVDGQIVLSKELFANGIRPAMKVGLSLSRVGSSAQSKFLKQLCGSLRLELSQHEEYEQLLRFNSDISPEIAVLLERGNLLKKTLTQTVNVPVPLWKQLLTLYGYKHKYIKNTEEINIINDIIEQSVDINAIENGNEVYIKSLLESVLYVKN